METIQLISKAYYHSISYLMALKYKAKPQTLLKPHEITSILKLYISLDIH